MNGLRLVLTGNVDRPVVGVAGVPSHVGLGGTATVHELPEVGARVHTSRGYGIVAKCNRLMRKKGQPMGVYVKFGNETVIFDKSLQNVIG